MEGFKKCSKGHFYKEEMDQCPYCPTSSENKDDLSNQGTDIPSEKTQAYEDGQEDDSLKTKVFGGPNSSPKENNTKKEFDPTRTIVTPNKKTEGAEENEGAEVVVRRKLRGWLVSFDIEEFGTDYKIFEGRNTLGSKPSSDITILDGEISGLHAVILFRKDKFSISDEMSTNGTLLNEQDLVPRTSNELNDGDEIKIGKTSLLFRSAIK